MTRPPGFHRQTFKKDRVVSHVLRQMEFEVREIFE